MVDLPGEEQVGLQPRPAKSLLMRSGDYPEGARDQLAPFDRQASIVRPGMRPDPDHDGTRPS